jgi:uncharacterized protein (DUF952 family)
MKRVVFVLAVVAVLVAFSYAVSDQDFLKLSFKSSATYQDLKVPLEPSLPVEPIQTTGLAAADNSQILLSKISPTALYVEAVNDYVFSEAYIYTTQGFVKFKFEGQTAEDDSRWIRGKATAVLDMTQYSVGDKAYIYAYICRELGPAVYSCNGNQWIAVSFEAKDGLLTEPFSQIKAESIQTSMPLPPPLPDRIE